MCSWSFILLPLPLPFQSTISVRFRLPEISSRSWRTGESSGIFSKAFSLDGRFYAVTLCCFSSFPFGDPNLIASILLTFILCSFWGKFVDRIACKSRILNEFHVLLFPIKLYLRDLLFFLFWIKFSGSSSEYYLCSDSTCYWSSTCFCFPLNCICVIRAFPLLGMGRMFLWKIQPLTALKNFVVALSYRSPKSSYGMLMSILQSGINITALMNF